MNLPIELSVLWERLDGPFGYRLSLALIHFLWQGVAVALIAALFIRVFGRRSPHRRYAIGLVGLLAMAIAPVVTFFLITPPAPTFHVVQTALTAGDVASARPIPPGELGSEIERLDRLIHSLETQLGEADRTGQFNESDRTLARSGSYGSASWFEPAYWFEIFRTWQPHLLLLWLAGTTLCALRLAVGAQASWRYRRRREPIPESAREALAKVCGRLGVTTPRVYVSERVLEAIAVGLFRPMILLPAAWIGRIPPELLEAVLAHEIAHLRRHDLWINLAQRCLETLLFYHPAVWWLSRRVRVEREYCCDEIAARTLDCRAAYARALEFVASERLLASRLATLDTALVAGMGGEEMALLNRVRRVLGSEPVPGRIRWRWATGAALLLPVCFWGVFLWADGFWASSFASAAGDKKASVEAEQPAAHAEVFGSPPEEPAEDGFAPPANEDPSVDATEESDEEQPRDSGPKEFPFEAAESDEASGQPKANSDKKSEDRELKQLVAKREEVREQMEEMTANLRELRKGPAFDFEEAYIERLVEALVESRMEFLDARVRKGDDSPEAKALEERVNILKREIAELKESREERQEQKGAKIRVFQKEIDELIKKSQSLTEEIDRRKDARGAQDGFAPATTVPASPAADPETVASNEFWIQIVKTEEKIREKISELKQVLAELPEDDPRRGKLQNEIRVLSINLAEGPTKDAAPPKPEEKPEIDALREQYEQALERQLDALRTQKERLEGPEKERLKALHERGEVAGSVVLELTNQIHEIDQQIVEILGKLLELKQDDRASGAAPPKLTPKRIPNVGPVKPGDDWRAPFPLETPAKPLPSGDYIDPWDRAPALEPAVEDATATPYDDQFGTRAFGKHGDFAIEFDSKTKTATVTFYDPGLTMLIHVETPLEKLPGLLERLSKRNKSESDTPPATSESRETPPDDGETDARFARPASEPTPKKSESADDPFKEAEPEDQSPFGDSLGSGA